MERNIYLSNTDLEEAVSLYMERLNPFVESFRTESVDVRESSGRVTAEPVFARMSSPNYNAAAMDGVMVRAAATLGATETDTKILERGKDFEYINTGQPILEPYDAVIMIEDVVFVHENEGNCRSFGSDGSSENLGNATTERLGIQTEKIKIIQPASPWQHIRPIGEDIVAGEMILPQKHEIRPMDIGAVLAGGVTKINVYARVRVAIMPTGTEISESYDSLEKGKIFDTNSWTFKAICDEMGCDTERVSPLGDDFPRLKEKIEELTSRNDIVVINAGSSAGSKDFTSAVLGEIGEVVLHGIAIKPGKPTILAMINGKPVIGVPGYPGSAFLVFEEVVCPLIRRLQRLGMGQEQYAEAVLSRRLVSSIKYREYVRVKLGKVENKLVATPLNRGAGVTMSLVKADGLLVIPKNSEGIEAGECTRVKLTKPLAEIENTIVSIGSHDLVMDHISSLLEKKGSFHLSSAHVGSMGGIMALMRGEAHIAPIHLLDEASGIYNEAYMDKYLEGKAILVKGIRREQGFMVPAGNPKGIKGIADLSRTDLVFVNRQRGAGTRVLTDYLIKKEGIEAGSIIGYDREMTTHMAVAAAVDGGNADVGVGVYSAAKAMNLDFIPIGYEEYDFAILKSFYESKQIKAFLEVLRSEEFERILRELGGYGL